MSETCSGNCASCGEECASREQESLLAQANPLSNVKKVIAEQLSINEADIKNESAFIEDLGADSLDTVELVMALEDAFKIEIPDDQQEKLRTVQQAIDYIQANAK